MHNFLAWLNDSENEIMMALAMLTEQCHLLVCFLEALEMVFVRLLLSSFFLLSCVFVTCYVFYKVCFESEIKNELLLIIYLFDHAETRIVLLFWLSPIGQRSDRNLKTRY